MKHPTIDSLRVALRDLLTASEDYWSTMARECVRVLVVDDGQTQAELVEKGKELSGAHERARDVLLDVAERLEEDERETQPALPDDGDDASDAARALNAQISDQEIAERAARAVVLGGGKPR